MRLAFAALLAAAPALASTPAGLPVDKEIVRVNGVPIRQSELLERLLKRYGTQTVDEMVDELLLRQAAEARRVKADDAEVERRFKRLQSQFGSKELLESQLEQAGTTAAKVKEDLSDEIVREKLIASAKGLSVSEDDLRKAYEQNKDKLGKPESVHLRHILVKDDAEAKEVVAKIKAGADFAALAKQHSLAASKSVGGDYGYVSRGMLPPEIDDIAFSLKPGEIRVVPGTRGRHILQALDKKAPQPSSFDEVKGDLRELLLTEKIKEAAPAFLQDLRAKADIKSPGDAAAPGRGVPPPPGRR